MTKIPYDCYRVHLTKKKELFQPGKDRAILSLPLLARTIIYRADTA